MKINKPIRLIELFGGYGSQAIALEQIGADFEKYRLCEWETNVFKSYKAIHFPDDTTDYSRDLSKVQLEQTLFQFGISNDGINQMTLEMIKRKNEKWLRETYNAIFATHNLINIKNISGKDLDIKETDKFCYILTYSFPCQDLSLAGKRKGMSKGSETRSGLLWEVERLLQEIVDNHGELPQVLLMENVKQVISKKNKPDFDKWCSFLESIGYSNTYEVLNAKDYGVPQNRERCFMFSFLKENVDYKFPEKILLNKRVKDILEESVEKKYYIDTELASQLIKRVVESNTIKDFKNDCDKNKINKVGNLNPCGHGLNGTVVEENGISMTITTNKGEGQKILVQNERFFRQAKETFESNDCNYGDTINAFNRTVCKTGISPTLTTRPEGFKTAIIPVTKQLKIRKLTPKECGRLMAVPERYIDKMEKIHSNSQLYKQFGNSIVVNCLIALFSNLNIQGLPNWDEIKKNF